MIKELQYKGYATEPSDYECPDGQLAMSLNLINEDSQLKPVFQPSELAELPSGYNVVYIHDTNTFTHYILLNKNTNTLYWIDEDFIKNANVKPVSSATIKTELAQTNPSRKLYLFKTTKIYNVNGIGNTLVVLTANGMHYLLWKGDNDGYLYLGTHIPECPLSFGLQARVVKSEQFSVDINETTSVDLDEDNQNRITSAVLAKVNKFIADNSTNAGRFIFPFFVRYAYRLYDGSLTMHSSPILMVCCTSGCPIAQFKTLTINGNEYKSVNDIVIIAASHELDYAVQFVNRLDKLKEWKDIVQSIDIFISKPIYTYDQNGKIKDIASHGVGSTAVCKHVNQHGSIDKNRYPLMYSYRDMVGMFYNTFPDEDRTQYLGLGLPYKTQTQVEADLRATSQFYFLKSIKLEDLTTTRTIVPIESDYLQSLVNREVMTDDFDSHDELVPRYSFGYNARLNITAIKKTLYQNFNTADMVCYTNAQIEEELFNESAVLRPNHNYKLFFLIKQDGKEFVVEGESSELSIDAPFFYFYYPNTNAYKVILKDITEGKYYEYPLERHGFLNGAYYFKGFHGDLLPGTPQRGGKEISGVVATENNVIDVPNKIYTSEVNNPFYFPVLGINTVGTGTILGISAAAKAMSQGQFGQFPLYAFTTEGVWALEVSSTGTYSARQPITRDVCINTDSITQIDSSVLFATDRGIMLISGSQTQCITDSIFSEAPFNVLDLPGIDQLHAKLGHSADACLPMQSFLGFLAGCQMVYDYVHQRIFVYNPTKVNGSPKYTYAYVFSLKSKMWGMVFTNLASTINSYPEALAMTLDNKLVSFSETDEQVCKGLYITRPLKLEAADVHKTISTLIQRGHFQRGDVGTVLYGSRDLFTWHLVWSSKDHYLRGLRGTPYKYFRIAGLATLTDGKSIFGASLSFETRHTNQLR